MAPVLVPVPWQPHLLLTPSTLGYFERAGARLGTTLYFNDDEWETISPCWRPYAQQAAARDKFLHHGGPVASSPDTGQRNHMRGAAGDLRRTDSAVRAACRAVGLKPDPVEDWHWNDPNGSPWGPMPIILSFTSPEGTDSITPIQDEEEDTVQKPTVAHRTDGAPEWSLIAPWIIGSTALEQGYKITADSKVGVAWSRMYAGGAGHATLEVTRDGGYIDAQNAARDLRADYLAAIARGETA